MNFELEKLHNLYESHFGEKVTISAPVPPSGSARRYVYLTSENHTAVGSFAPDLQENEAFFTFTRHFKNRGLNVPELYAVAEDKRYYLQENVGRQALYDLLPAAGEKFHERLIDLYKKSLAALAKMQITGGKNLDYSVAYPRAAFDRQSMLWDCNYCKYYFLKPAGAAFNEQDLEDDFQRLINFLTTADSDFFLFRDFQSRNILIQNNEPYFIDYQGGRKGALQYDVASLLYQAKANLSETLRENLLDFYLSEAEKLTAIDATAFKKHYYAFVLLRQIQVLGAYGLRGLTEGKSHFIKSIPFALRNIQHLFMSGKIELDLPVLKAIFSNLNQNFMPQNKEENAAKNLTVTVQSFSYKKSGIPQDPSGNGGGFVFDCRFIHNPGRYAPYKKLSGLDRPVIDFLRSKSTIDTFVQNALRITDEAVENYLARDFASLMISYGCTGGQHRSVYSAEATAQHLREKYGVKVILRHLEKEDWLPVDG